MIILKTHKTKYGYKNTRCPFCKMELFTRRSHIYRHIAAKAKGEAIKKQLGEKTTTKHLDFYISNTLLVRYEKREWKVNLFKQIWPPAKNVSNESSPDPPQT